MFLLSKPGESSIQTLLAKRRSEEFSYAEVGASRGEIPKDYALLNGHTELGRGAATFANAAEAVRRWKMFDVPGMQLCWPHAPIEVGTEVAVVVHHFGFWSINFCRIVYVIDEDGPVRRYGFAYGTLREHAEQGEERFSVEWDRASDIVSYEVLSFSRPGSVLTRIAYPLARRLQKQFVRNSLAAMVRATAATGPATK